MSKLIKICNRCLKPNNISFFRKDNGAKDGLKARCKKCMSEVDAAVYLERKEAFAAKDARYYKKNKDIILKRNRVWCAANKNTLKESRQTYHKKNRGVILEKQREYYLKTKEVKKEKDRIYYINNKNKSFAKAAKRRANKLQAAPAWANKKYMSLWFKFAKMESERTGRKVHVDHIIPLKGVLVCGLHCEDNLQLLFSEENISKSNKLLPCSLYSVAEIYQEVR